VIESKKVTVNFSNLEFITKLSGVVQILAILLVFLGGVLQASKFFLDKRINSMKEDFTRNEKSQSQLVISDLQSTIKQQDQKIEQQTKQVEGYQKKLLEVELKTKPRIIPEDKLKSLRADLTKHKGVSIEITWEIKRPLPSPLSLKRYFNHLGGQSMESIRQCIQPQLRA